MNDRFKFRVWRIKENCYNHQEPFPTCCMQENGLLAYFREEKQMQNYIVEQCTGLRDINGKLIYEGDIVRFVKQRGYYTQKGAIYTIEFGVFRFCGFGWRNRPEHDVEFALTESAAKKCEIIGNIHEQRTNDDK